jgi:hypothetical protein
MNAYYNNTYSKALSHFWKLLRPRSKWKIKKEMMKKAEDICLKISIELEEDAPEESRKASLLAERIKKCYEEIRRSS